MERNNIKFTDISYFAGHSSSTGHFWMHEALKIQLGGAKYEFFSRSRVKGRGGRLSSFGYENGAGRFTKLLAQFEANKILRNSKFDEDENQILFFYEGGSFEFQLCMELAHKLTKGKVWFNFHDAIFWAQACELPAKFAGLSESLNHPVSRKRVVFSAESGELASMLSNTFEFPCHAFPLYSTLTQQLGDIPLKKIPWASRQFDLLIIVGDFEMAPKVAAYVEAAQSAIGPKASIHVHWSGRDFETIGELEDSKLTQSFGQINPEDYVSQLVDSRFTLLFYPAQRYEHKSSGRIEDALLCGSIPIVPAKTSLVTQNSRSLPSFECPEDLIKVLTDYSELRLKAVDAETFLNEMKSVFTSCGQVTKSSDLAKPRPAKLKFPNPIKRKRLVDKLSVWRIRLGVPDETIRVPRGLYRRARQNWNIF